MIVLIDIGNTRAKYQVISSNHSKAIRFVDNEQITSAWLTQEFESAQEVILANVNAHRFTQIINTWANEHVIPFIQVKVTDSAFGVRCGYDQPEQLGVDRWLVVLAAAKLHPNNKVVIIDSGTATTIDVLDRGKQYCGGWILPGVNTMKNSLFQSTKQIEQSSDTIPSFTLGTNTGVAVNNGAWAATAGAVTTCLSAIADDDNAPTVLLTGGNGQILASLIRQPCHYIDDLVFQGMYRFNQTEPR